MKSHQSIEAQKTKIIEQISGLSRLLGMIPSDDTVVMNDPVTNDSKMLSNWMSDARNSFLKLSMLVGDALEIRLQ